MEYPDQRLRDGQIIGSTHDNLDRVTLKDLLAPETDVTYAYDLQNRLLSATQGSASLSRTYDARGRMLSESTAQGVMTYSTMRRTGAPARAGPTASSSPRTLGATVGTAEKVAPAVVNTMNRGVEELKEILGK